MYRTTVSIDVPDLASAVRFYTDGLGFEVKREATEGMAVLQSLNLDVYLLEKPDGSRGTASTSRSYARHWTPVHLDFVVPDLAAALERVVAAGAEHEGGDEGEWGAIAYCSDPFGHGFCLIEE